jgi:Ohr subfamily peroxiredoxin
MHAIYTAHATATGGRDGAASTPDKTIDLRLGVPKEMGGSGVGTNPEQLFAAGYAACFLGAMKFVGGKAKIAVPSDAKIESTVGIGERDDKQGFGIVVSLKVFLPGVPHEQAEELVKKADVVCPYSHAIRGNVKVDISIA